MSAEFVTGFLLLVPAAAVVLDVNATVGQPWVILPCTLMTETPTRLEDLLLYWQDDRQHVLYSYKKGNEMPEHVNRRYRDRITAFPLGMTAGNISVKLKNSALEDEGRVFQAFAALYNSRGARRYSSDLREICQITLHVAVPYSSVSVAVNEEARTAVCTAQRGFPEASLRWRAQDLHNNSQCFIDPKDVKTTTVQNSQDRLYSLNSTINIPGGRYRSVSCLIHNPTLNVTDSDTYVLNKGERSLPDWPAGLTAAFVLLVSALQQLIRCGSS
ncbi:CD276 antigen homolog [Chaetodon trifascialis]|uniref:CD276 antigen homolog n=1 Tax=Chaetodon trifascialis TaxID=109706 RepID=UPI003994E364